jgi:hypothetical protein
VKAGLLIGLGALMLFAAQENFAQGGSLNVPKTVQAGSAFSIPTSGSGKASLYIIGLGQVLKRDVQLGEPVSFAEGSLHDAGRYLLILTQGEGGSAAETDALDVTPASTAAHLSLLAKPSRLPVSLHDGITGAAYVFDAYGNLILAPLPVAFEISGPSGTAQNSNTMTRAGAAWVEMDSTGKQGIDQFAVKVQGISSTRVVRQVPGDPCALKMSAQASGEKLELKTDPVLDCSGNAVLDGTIVTFSESYDGGQSTVDVPLKHGIAQVTIPAHRGAVLTVACGVVLGNQIRWE